MPLRRLLLVTCLLLGALAAGPPGAAATPPPVPDLAWADCGDGFECATAAVPRTYARPRGATIDLALIRKRATGPAAERLGSLFLNPGGPGGSIHDFVRSGGAEGGFLAALNERFDLVGMDPRGNGLSEGAVDCEVDPEVLGPFSQPFPRPERESETAFVRRTRAYLDRCLALNDRELLNHLSTGNIARDLDLLRRAVGDDDLTYLGFSYGTVLGATYATLFPRTTGRLVLDGALDPEAWWNEVFEGTREQTAGFERALGRFFQACAADKATCPFGGADPHDAFDVLAERMDAQPLPTPQGDPARPVDGDDLRNASILAMYSKGLWSLLAQALTLADAGDGSLVQLLNDAAYGREEEGPDSAGTDQFVAVTGVDSRRQGGVSAYLDAGEHAYGLFDHFWFNSGYGDLPFGLWPAAGPGIFRGPVETAPRAPTSLVVGTTYDTATPYIWAKRLTADLGNARLLTMRGDGHTAYGGNSACIDAAVEAYLEEGALPAVGATCRQEVPFAAPPATARAARAGARAQLRAARRALREEPLLPFARP